MAPDHPIRGAVAPSDARYRRLVEHVRDAVVVLDRDLRVAEWNPAAESMLGFAREDVLGQSLPCVPRDRAGRGCAPYQRALERLRAGEEVRALDVFAVTRDGRTLPFELDGYPSVGPGEGMPWDGCTLLLRHLTERLAFEAQGPAASVATGGPSRLGALVGASRAMIDVFAKAARAAHVQSPVLISGESGTGKDVLARAIHEEGARRGGPFVAVNCGAFPRDLIESELFGHRRGAFTGATADAPGLFRSGQGGTVFLDEISEMPVDLQVRLLRVLQDRRVRAVGDVREVPVDVRFVAATNRDLRETLESGRLRCDLYYRLSVIAIAIPPLRERPEDLACLVGEILDRLAPRFGRRIDGFAPEVLAALRAHPWPGNVRELENFVEGLLVAGKAGCIQLDDLPPEFRSPPGDGTPPQALTTMAAAEHDLILRTVRACGGNKAEAARALAISRTYLYKRLGDNGLRLPE